MLAKFYPGPPRYNLPDFPEKAIPTMAILVKN